MITLNYNGRAINTNYDALIENYNGKTLTIETDARLDNYGNELAFYAKAHDDSGNEYEVRWDYVEPDWYINEEETPVNNDLSEFADWNHPAEVTEL